MTANDVLIDGFGRIREIVHEVLDGLDPGRAGLPRRPGSQLDLLAHLASDQSSGRSHRRGRRPGAGLVAAGWEKRCGLPLDPGDIGYGHDADEVGSVRLRRDLLAGYHDATCDQTIAFVGALTDADLAKVVDRRWDPPVTMTVRLVSVLADDLQHAGQAAFIKGLLQRRG